MRAILVCLSAMNFDDQYFVPRIIIVLLCLVIVVIAYRQLKHKWIVRLFGLINSL